MIIAYTSLESLDNFSNYELTGLVYWENRIILVVKNKGKLIKCRVESSNPLYNRIRKY